MEADFDNPLGSFGFTGRFDGYVLSMELYDFARAYELWDTTVDGRCLVATGYSADKLPPEFPASAVKAIRTFETWISNTEVRS